MVDLATTYMGIRLKNPIVPSASPLSADLVKIKQMEDAGAAAVVLHSLFEEQIETEAEALAYYLERGTESFYEALTYFPPMEDYRREPDEYLEHIRQARKAVDIPIIASLNGVTPGGWVSYARHFQEAGADAVELNVYWIPTDFGLMSYDVEDMYVKILRRVKDQVSIPVAMKLSPYFSALPHVASMLDAEGADGLALFNRFYQPDLDIEALEVRPNLVLSRSSEIRLPLRWIAILYGHVGASLALTTGIHTPEDALKAIMAGADVAHVCSLMLREGIGRISDLINGMTLWMEEHEYESLAQMKGSLSQKAVADPMAFERANYMKTLLTPESTITL
ncbi:MAG: dihydroorotate dehydrogenase-like protein [Anaerolineae bacterium]|jgi:dihydroorotate dehydrogenase (fumarate)|nr:dihydroorotate dehydrogenase-like protein [Anaerolineae bacterium]